MAFLALVSNCRPSAVWRRPSAPRGRRSGAPWNGWRRTAWCGAGFGSGTYVDYQNTGGGPDIAEVTSPLELMEVRLAIEPHIARLAVRNATPRDLERIAGALERIEAVGADADRFSRRDQDFHLALAEGTHNPFLIDITRQVNAIRSHAQWHATKDKILSPDRIDDYNRQHSALFEALQRRDGEAVAQLMTAHLIKARTDLLGADSA
jgi:DNA-binding FadR family transcriptional regulator